MSKKLIVSLLAFLNMCVCGMELTNQHGYRDFYRNAMKAKLVLAKAQAHKFESKKSEEREPAHGVPASKKDNDQSIKVRAKL